METKASERSEFAALVLLSSVSHQRGTAKLAEQESWCFSERSPRVLCANGGLDGDRAGARGAATSRDRRSWLPAGRSALDPGHWMLGERASGVLGAVLAARDRRK